MRTPSPDTIPGPEQYRREVQSRIQNLLSGQRPRHPVLSQYSTRRLILEDVLEEVRIYRLNKEQKVLKAREEADRMDVRRGKEEQGKGRRGGRSKDRGESSHQGRRRDNREEEKFLLAGEAAHHDTELHHGSPGFMMSSGASGPPPLDKVAARPKSSPPRSLKQQRGHTYSRLSSPGEGSSQVKQRFDRNGKPLVRGKRGWRDASPAPFPEYKFKPGPMLGLGDHLKERFRWGVENYHSEQRRKERRERGGLDERKMVRKGKEDRKNEGERKEKKPMSKSESKMPVKDDHVSHVRRGEPSKEASELGRSAHAHARHVDQVRIGNYPEHDGVEKHEEKSGRRSTHDDRTDQMRRTHAEADAQSRGERHARHETDASQNSSHHQETSRLTSQNSVYEQTPHSQRVEERERAQAERIAANNENPRGTKESNNHPCGAQESQNLGTTGTAATQWWSDRSESPSDDGRHRSSDSDDERYFSDHFIEKLRSKTGSVASGSTTSLPRRPKGGEHGHRELSPVDETRRETDQAGRLRKNEDKGENSSRLSSASSSVRPRSTSVSSMSDPGSPEPRPSRTISISRPVPEISVHSPSDSERSSDSEKSWAQKLASEVKNPNKNKDKAGQRSSGG